MRALRGGGVTGFAGQPPLEIATAAGHSDGTGSGYRLPGMTTTTPLLWLLALIAGALIPVQAAANAGLSRSIHDNVPFAAMMLFIIAGMATAAAMVLTGSSIPRVAELSRAPWWSYLGGLIVAFYVLTITFLVPRIGVGTAIALIVTGQIMAALAIDHFGLLRSLTFHLTLTRSVGAALMITGAFLALRR
jgi:transporter family-2 protein